MTPGYPKQPAAISILAGILACIALAFTMSRLDDIVKWTGNIFLFIPSKLGIIEMVTPKDVITVDFSTNPTTVYFPKAGAYDLYIDNLDLLSVTDALTASERSWLIIKKDGQGAPLKVLFFTRGLYAYDTPFAKGRPVYYFEIKEPGYYEMTHPTRPTDVYFVPDYNTYNEPRVIIAYIVQIILFGVPLGWFGYRRWQKYRKPFRDARRQRRDEVDRFWREHHSQQKEADHPDHG
jgi:hypothetical protein